MAQDDWSVQLKKIEREFQGLPPEPSPAFKKMQSEEERRAQERAYQRAAMIGAGARLILVFALGVALAFWPYDRECGGGLFGFLGVEIVIVFWHVCERLREDLLAADAQPFLAKPAFETFLAALKGLEYGLGA